MTTADDERPEDITHPAVDRAYVEAYYCNNCHDFFRDGNRKGHYFNGDAIICPVEEEDEDCHMNSRRIGTCEKCGARIVLRWISGFESTVHTCPDNPETEAQIGEAYARYDSDPRVSGVDDIDAFIEAVRPLTAKSNA